MRERSIFYLLCLLMHLISIVVHDDKAVLYLLCISETALYQNALLYSYSPTVNKLNSSDVSHALWPEPCSGQLG